MFIPSYWNRLPPRLYILGVIYILRHKNDYDLLHQVEKKYLYEVVEIHRARLTWCCINICLSLKPIFHCNMNSHALGSRVWYDPQHEHFAFPIPTCWYTKRLLYSTWSLLYPTQSLVYLTRSLEYPTRSLVDPMQAQRNLQREQVEYTLRWAILRLLCVGHVDFMLFVTCLLPLATQRETDFWWNMGLINEGKIMGVLFSAAHGG